MKNTLFRLVRPDDLPAVWKTFLTSYRDMVRSVHGNQGSTSYSKQPPPYLSQVLQTDAQSFWVAECRGKIVGFACAIVRGRIWFLADFWMLPQFQGQGIGRELLKRSLRSNKGYDIIATYSSLFPAAMRRYILLGMTPRFPVYTLTAESRNLRLSRRLDDSMSVIELPGDASPDAVHRAVQLMGAIDRRVRGSRRDEDHEFFVRRNQMRCWLARKGQRDAGYFYLSTRGQIGPLAAASAEVKLPLLVHAVRLGKRLHARLTVRVPGVNVESIRWLLNAGFRLDSHALFMSSEEFGAMENYIISGPALF